MSSLFNTDNPAIAEAQQRVLDCLFTRPKVVTDIEQQKLKTAVRDQHKDMRREQSLVACDDCGAEFPFALLHPWPYLPMLLCAECTMARRENVRGDE